MGQLKSALKIIASKVLGLFIFLILVLLINILTYFIQNQFLEMIVRFFNSNLWILILMSIIFMLAEIFWVLDYPLNLPAPFLSAVSSLFLVAFLLETVKMIGISSNLFPERIIQLVPIIVYPLVFLVVLVIGYVKIYQKQKK